MSSNATTAATAASLRHVYAGAPNVTRGIPTQLHTDAAHAKLLYGSGSSVVIRDIKSPEQCEFFNGHTTNVTAVAMAPDNVHFISGDDQGNVKVVQNKSYRVKYETHALTGAIRDVAWCCENQRVAVGGEGTRMFASVFKADIGSSLGDLTLHQGTVWSLDFNPKRPHRLITIGDDLQCGYWKGPPFKTENVMYKTYTKGSYCVRFNHDGSRYADCGQDRLIRLFDGASGEFVTSYNGGKDGHKGSIFALSWSPDNSKLISCCSDKTCKLWDVTTGNVITTFGMGSTLDDQQCGVIWAGDSIVSVDLAGRLNYLDMNNPNKPLRVIHNHKSTVLSLAYDKNSNNFFSGGEDGAIKYSEVDKSVINFNGLGFNNDASCMTVKDDVLHVIGDSVLKQLTVSSIHQNAQICQTIVMPHKPLAFVLAGPQRTVVLTTKSVVLVVNDKIIFEFELKYQPLCVAISPDFQAAAIGGADKKVRLYKVSADNISESCILDTENRGKVTCIAYSPSGDRLAFGDSECEMICYDVRKNEPLTFGLVFHFARVVSIAFGANDDQIVSGGNDECIIVWNMKNLRRRFSVQNAHRGSVNCVTFLSDGRVISGGMDRCVRIWNVPADTFDST